MIVAAVCAVHFAFAAGELEDAVLHGETDKARAIDYGPGEEMVFTLSLQGVKELPPDAYFISWTRTGDDGQTERGKAPASLSQPLVVKTSLDRPGFVRILAVVVDKDGNAYRKSFHGDPNTPEGKKALNEFERRDKRVFFDGGAGVCVDRLQSVPEPDDFDAFWARRKERLAKVPMTPTLNEKKVPETSLARVYKFSVPCAGPRPVTGHLTVPKAKGRYPARISFHGYGSHFVETIPSSGPGDMITMFINAHGYDLEREPEYYDEFYKSIMSNGKTFGFCDVRNRDPESAYFSGMTYRIMRALQFLKSLPEWDGKNLEARGGSMGGLQTVWAAGLDPDVTVASPSIPWCCDIGGRDTLKRIIDPWYIHETPALRYYDPVNIAKRISRSCRVNIMRAGLGDYCCPPSGVAILYNNIPGPKKINWVQGSTHGYVPPEPHQAFSLTANGWTE